MAQIQWKAYDRHITLSDLDSFDFAVDFPMTDNALAILRCLTKHPVVIELRRRLENGSLDEAQCKSFVHQLLEDFQQQQSLHHHALSGMCAVFHRFDRPFAKKFLSELANLSDTVEFGRAGRVAEAALKDRY